MDKITFPCKVSDKVVNAFKKDRQRERTAKILITALFEIVSDENIKTGWDMLGDEHPDLLEYRETHPTDCFSYSDATQTITVKKE